MTDKLIHQVTRHDLGDIGIEDLVRRSTDDVVSLVGLLAKDVEDLRLDIVLSHRSPVAESYGTPVERLTSLVKAIGYRTGVVSAFVQSELGTAAADLIEPEGNSPEDECGCSSRRTIQQADADDEHDTSMRYGFCTAKELLVEAARARDAQRIAAMVEEDFRRLADRA